MQKTITSLTDIPAVAAYFARIGAEPRTLRAGVVRVERGRGYWQDIARISVSIETGDVKIYNNNDATLSPSKQELAEIKAQIGDYCFPASKKALNYKLPPHLKQAEKEDRLFLFKDKDGLLLMAVERRELLSAKKVYHPWTLYEDDEWRNQEPDGQLPLYNLDSLEAQHTTVFIHEGPKAARAVHRLINPYTDEEKVISAAHPWIDDLSLPDTCHLGWHGGALNPYRTDWSVLQRHGVKNVYIVADNDSYGVDATPKIARQLDGMLVRSIRFDNGFKPGFDLADPFPPHMFKDERYVGPLFDDMLVPATWAVDAKPSEQKGKFIYTLREEFAAQWRWCSEQGIYVNINRPGMRFDEDRFESELRPFSGGAKSVSTLLKTMWSCHSGGITYRPDKADDRIINEEDCPGAVNVYVAPKLKAVEGDPKPWLDYLEHLIVLPHERHEVMRWCATLIARPEIRMTYSLLLISDMQGTGKTTLAAQVLAPLVGARNVSFPDEKVIVDSQFNSWVVEKRLVIISEIYPGGSWRTYQGLKGYVSDTKMEVHRKYYETYSSGCWAHFVCSSNFIKAMKIDPRDRRWYIPEVVEYYWGEDEKKHKENFTNFRHWLVTQGGLKIIKHWAENFGDYVKSGEHPPVTTRKSEIIEEGRASPEKLLRSWAAENKDKDVVAIDREIVKYLKDEGEETKFFTPRELRKVLENLGWRDPGFELTFNGVKQRMVMSPVLYSKWVGLNGASPQELRDFIRTKIKSPLISANERSF